MVRDIRFDKVHAAAYSTRPGTIADRLMTDNVPYEEKKARLKVIEETQQRIAAEINASLQGRTMEVLVEGRKRGRWSGRNRNDKIVYFEDDADRTGRMVDVTVDSTGPWSLQGVLAS
jgi:tRNA-2-methylthio-N6-dimethylallyladenosine synthase